VAEKELCAGCWKVLPALGERGKKKVGGNEQNSNNLARSREKTTRRREKDVSVKVFFCWKKKNKRIRGVTGNLRGKKTGGHRRPRGGHLPRVGNGGPAANTKKRGGKHKTSIKKRGGKGGG